MDPVSKILSDREASRPRMAPWIVVAAVLHGSLAAAIFLAGRTASARPAHLPSVSVKIVQPRRQPPRSRPTARPRPTAAAPRPTAAPTRVPKPQPTAIRDTAVTEDAMPAAENSAATVPTPDETGPSDGGAGGGLSLGDSSANRPAGIPADFHFTYYVERMLALIESRWYKPAVPPNTRAQVRFRIHRDGRVDGIVLEESSRNSSFDRAALRALYAANPLPPLPPAYGKPTLTVHLAFSE